MKRIAGLAVIMGRTPEFGLRYVPCALAGALALLAGCANEASPKSAAAIQAERAEPQPVSEPSSTATPDAAATPNVPLGVAKSAVYVRTDNGRKPVDSESDYYPEPTQLDPPRAAEMARPYPNLGPLESAYFSGKYVNQDTVGKAMRKRDFDGLVLDLQNQGDANALARQQAYAAAFAKSLQPYADRSRLGRIGCGAVLCMGSLRTSSTEWLQQWSVDLHDTQLPLPTMMLNSVPIGTEYEVRFAFATAGYGGLRSGGR